MSSFTGALITRHKDGKLFVENAFEYLLFNVHTNIYAKVAAGFLTDLVTTYWFIGWFLKKIGKHDRTGALHDSLYAEPYLYYKVDDEEHRLRISKFRCDFILYEAAITDEVNQRKAAVMWMGLTLFGWVAWHKHRRAEIKRLMIQAATNDYTMPTKEDKNV